MSFEPSNKLINGDSAPMSARYTGFSGSCKPQRIDLMTNSQSTDQSTDNLFECRSASTTVIRKRIHRKTRYFCGSCVAVHEPRYRASPKTARHQIAFGIRRKRSSISAKNSTCATKATNCGCEQQELRLTPPREDRHLSRHSRFGNPSCDQSVSSTT